jgi:hypothetical protein
VLTKVSAFGDFFCLEAFGALDQSKLDFLTFVQATVSIPLNSTKVNEDVIWPVGHCDKAETLSVIEPLNGSRLAV